MAFTSTISNTDTIGNFRLLFGTYTSTGGTTGGAINFNTFVPQFIYFCSTSASPSDVQAVTSGSTVTITTAANQTGTFVAFGE